MTKLQEQKIHILKSFNIDNWRNWIEDVLENQARFPLGPEHFYEEPEETFVLIFELLQNAKLKKSICLFEQAVADRINAYPKNNEYAYELDALLSIALAARSQLLGSILLREFREENFIKLKRVDRSYTLHSIIVQVLTNTALNLEESKNVLNALLKQILVYEFDLTFYVKSLSFATRFDSRLERFFILLNVIINKIEKEEMDLTLKAYVENSIVLELINCAEYRGSIFYKRMMEWMNSVCRQPFVYDRAYEKTRIWSTILEAFYVWLKKHHDDMYLEPSLASLRFVILTKSVPGKKWFLLLKDITVHGQQQLIDMDFSEKQKFEENDFYKFNKAQLIALFFMLTKQPMAVDNKEVNRLFDIWYSILKKMSNKGLLYFLVSICKEEMYKGNYQITPKGLNLKFDDNLKEIHIDHPELVGFIKDIDRAEPVKKDLMKALGIQQY